MFETSSAQDNTALGLPNGTRLHLPTHEHHGDATFIVREIFHQRVYDHPGFELRATDTIVDIGAHVGVFAHWALPQIPNGRLICVEPTSAADRLEHSLMQNGLTNVRLHRMALGRPSSTLEMFDHAEYAGLNRSTAFRPSPWMSSIMASKEKKGITRPPKVRSFPCESLTELLVRENLAEVDLLKMDCEGSEYDILEHTSDENLRRCKKIMMEFHVFHASHSLPALRKRLKGCGFAVDMSKPWLHYLLHRTGMLWAVRID